MKYLKDLALHLLIGYISFTVVLTVGCLVIDIIIKLLA